MVAQDLRHAYPHRRGIGRVRPAPESAPRSLRFTMPGIALPYDIGLSIAVVDDPAGRVDTVRESTSSAPGITDSCLPPLGYSISSY